MKKVLVLAMVAALTVNASAQRNEDKVRTNVIKIDPIGLLFGSGGITYEKAFGGKHSVAVTGIYAGYKIGDFKYSNAGGGLEYRYYAGAKEAPAGFYIAPGGRFTSGKAKTDANDETKFSSFAVRAMIGNQWIFGSGFVIDLGGGIGYRSFNYDNTTGVFSGLKTSGVIPEIRFAIGYAF